jgi:tetratricopeptide (TPR) repeat protein
MTIEEAFNLAVRYHTSGRPAEAESIYRQILAQHPAHKLSLLNLGTLLQSLGRNADAIAVYHAGLTIDPSLAEVWCNLANVLTDIDRLDDAMDACRKSLALDPRAAATHNNLANIFNRTRDWESAKSHYRQAITLQPDFASAHSNLGTILHAEGDLQGAADCFQTAVKLSPDFPEAHNNLGGALADLGHRRQALASFQKAVELRPNFASPHWNLGLIYLLEGDLNRGWSEYEWRWQIKNLIQPAFKFTQPRWNGEDLRGRRILLHAEQGFGDAIHFSRFAPLVARRGGKVILFCPQEVVRLLQSVEGVEQVVEWNDPLPPFDLECPLLSLPRVFQTDLTNIPASVPYISPDPTSKAAWQARLHPIDGLKVGLAWAGRPTHARELQRSIPLAAFSPLARLPRVRFFSLQKGLPAQQAATAPFPLTDWTSDLTDFADTATLVDNLDLVITADTAVAHLAGALNKPVWTLLPHTPDWRWMLDRPDSPWYPTMRLFRQPTPGDWCTPIEQVVQSLKSLA